MTTQPALFGTETASNYGKSEEEKAVHALIDELEANNAMTTKKRALCVSALRLAQIASQPKSAIAAVQALDKLTDLLDRIDPEPTGSDAALSTEMKDLINALTIDPPLHARTETSNPPEPGPNESASP